MAIGTTDLTSQESQDGWLEAQKPAPVVYRKHVLVRPRGMCLFPHLQNFAVHIGVQKPPAERRRPRDTVETCLPRPSHRQTGGRPEGHRRETGAYTSAYTRPLSNASGKAAENKGHRRDTGRIPGTPGRTSDPFAVHQAPRLPRKSHRQSGGDQWTPEGHRRDTGGTPEGHRRDTGETPEGHRRDTGGTPEGHRRDTGGTPEGHRRDTGGTPEGHRRDTGGTPEGHRRDTGGTPAYIRPLCSAPSPTPATQKPPAERRRPRDTGGTRGRTSDSFAVCKSRACHAKATGRAAETKERERDTGVYIRPRMKCVRDWHVCVCESDVLDVMLDNIVCVGWYQCVCVCAWCIGCDAWWYCV